MKTLKLCLLFLFTTLCAINVVLGQDITQEDVLRDHGIFVKEIPDSNNEIITNNRIYFQDLEQLVDTILTYSYTTPDDSTLSGMSVNEFNDLRQTILTTNYTYIDSISVWQFNSKVNMEYNSFGNLALRVYVNWSAEDTAWINSSKFLYDFDEFGNRLLYEYWRWNVELSHWYGYYKYIYEFNAVGDKTYEQKWSWSDELFDWVNKHYIEDVYNEYGQTHHEHWSWDQDSSYWYGNLMSNRYYNALGHDTSYLTYNWVDNDWRILWKYENSFNETGNRTQTIMTQWEPDSLVWLNMRKTVFEYHSCGTYSLMQDANWSDDQQDYVKSRRWVNEFNDYELITEWEYSLWNDDLADWQPSWKELYEYDENNNKSMNAKWKWDSDNEIWYGDFMSEYSFDLNGNTIGRLAYWWSSDSTAWEGSFGYLECFDSEGFKCLRVNYVWDEVVFDWKIGTKDFYNYRLLIDVLENDEKLSFAYPNPVTDKLTISYLSDNQFDISLYSLSGRKLVSKTNVVSGNSIDVSSLLPGVYVLKIADGSIIKSQSVVVSGK